MNVKDKRNYLQIAGGLLMVAGILCLSFPVTKGLGYGLLIAGFVPVLIHLRYYSDFGSNAGDTKKNAR